MHNIFKTYSIIIYRYQGMDSWWDCKPEILHLRGVIDVMQIYLWKQTRYSGVLCIIHPSETDLNLSSWEVSFAYNVFHSLPIVLKFCTDVMDGWDFAWVEYKMSFGRIAHIAQRNRGLFNQKNWTRTRDFNHTDKTAMRLCHHWYSSSGNMI